MQVPRMLLVYDVKLSQLGRKNLAVRFNLIQHKDRIADGRRAVSDYEPDVAARVASAAKQKAAKEYFLA